MLIYDKKEKFIDIYSFNLNSVPAIQKYRKTELEKIPEEEKIIRGVTGTGNQSYEIFSLYKNKLEQEILDIGNVNGSYHKLEPDTIFGKGSNREGLLNAYYLGYLNDRKIARIWDLKKMRYLLLKQTEYKNYSDKKILEGILEIPESLYLLQLLEQGKFNLIGDKDISEQLQLFSNSYMDQINLEELERMDYFGVTDCVYQKTLKKAENDAHIIKRLNLK